jgi:two-component system chemotaxis response regulator CheB
MPKEQVKNIAPQEPVRPLLGQEPVREKFERLNLFNIRPAAMVIGCSTGGPNALETIFAKIRPPIAMPILIVQHMPPLFTEILAKRISDLCGLVCREGQDGEPIENGRVYLAPGDYHMEVVRGGVQNTIRLTKEPQRNSVRPAADYLFETAANAYGKNLLGIVLTGMGEDGLVGAQAIKRKNGAMIIQDKESCVVFGMPGAIFEYGYYDEIGNLDYITSVMNRLLHKENLT